VGNSRPHRVQIQPGDAPEHVHTVVSGDCPGRCSRRQGTSDQLCNGIETDSRPGHSLFHQSLKALPAWHARGLPRRHGHPEGAPARRVDPVEHALAAIPEGRRKGVGIGGHGIPDTGLVDQAIPGVAVTGGVVLVVVNLAAAEGEWRIRLGQAAGAAIGVVRRHQAAVEVETQVAGVGEGEDEVVPLPGV
jgi:hypothetical protein